MTGEAGLTRLIQPKTFEEAKVIATYLSESDLVPKEFQKKPANILLAWEMGADVGLSPMQALQSIAVINGKPSLYGEVGLGIVLASGLLEGLPLEEDDGEVATCTVKRKGCQPVTRTFSMAEARNATMWERDREGNLRKVALADRATWLSWPRRMRQMRARWWALKDAFADVLKGLAIVEVERDLGDVNGHLASDAGVVIETVGQEWMPQRIAEEPPPATIMGRTSPSDTPAPVALKDPPPAPAPVPSPAPVPPPQAEVPAPSPAPAAPASPAPTKAAQAGLTVTEQLQLAADKHAPKVQPAAPEPTQGGPVMFTVNGVPYLTQGLTREQFLEAAALVVDVDKKAGRGFGKRLLGKVLNLPVSDPKCHRVTLTEEQGKVWIGQMKEALA